MRNDSNFNITLPVKERGFPGGSVVKTHLLMQELWIQLLGQEDLLEKEMRPSPVFLPGKSHRQRSLAGTVHGGRGVVTKESDTT